MNIKKVGVARLDGFVSLIYSINALSFPPQTLLTDIPLSALKRLSLGDGFVGIDYATKEGGLIQRLRRRKHLFPASERDESKATEISGLLISRHVYSLHGTIRLEQLPNLLLGGRVWQIAYVGGGVVSLAIGNATTSR